jgi:hypothetical protein
MAEMAETPETVCHHYCRSSLSCHEHLPFALSLKRHGYAILSLDQLNLKEIECFQNWEQIFSRIFQQTTDEKDRISPFDSIQGQTMGYRREGLREFIETRLQGSLGGETETETVLPVIDKEEFHETVKIIWKVLRAVVVDVLSCMAHAIGIDPSYFLELIDQDPLPEGEVSSTVLRICSYPFDLNHSQESQVSFGAHTDTSFITIGTFSSTSGLEIQDLQTKSWLSIEEQLTPISSSSSVPLVAVFVGDVMQLLTSSFYTATVHRVRTYHRHPLKDHQMASPRVSCPFIVRGRHKTKIRSIQHFDRCLVPRERVAPLEGEGPNPDPPPSLPALQSTVQMSPPSPPCEPPLILVELPDFEDLNMKLIHTLLDRKRQKCLKQNEENEGDGEGEGEGEWVLRAF